MSLQNHLYNYSTVPEVLESYIKELSKSTDIQKIMHSNKLRAYQNVINDKTYLKEMQTLFNRTFDLLTKKHPRLRFSIAGRKKSLISTERKILQYTELGRSLDLIRDFFAFRIILFGDSTLNLIEHCYKVIEEIIELAINNGFTPCDRLPLLGVDDITDHKNEYFSKFKYKQFIKDYICFPKHNGYQSLHLVLVDTKGRYLEIQVRTLDMHSAIKAGDANHEDYKKSKYNLDFPLERKKIKLEGYRFVNDQITDFESVEIPGTVFQKQTL